MTTLSALKSEIADDLDRSDLTATIASEITNAIRHYQSKRFYWNETRDDTFSTAASQTWYSSTDDADIPTFIHIDGMWVVESSTNYYLTRVHPVFFEDLIDGTAASGRPFDFTYLNRQIGLYPIPDAVYTVRMMGHVLIDAPASDSEANNLWMTEAFDLLRFRAAKRIYRHKLKDPDNGLIAAQDEAAELERLQGETNRRVGTGKLTPTQF